MKVFIQVYDRCKYDEKSKVVAEEEKIIEGFEVKEISDEEMCDNGYNDFDPYHEYLILKKKKRKIGTLRNSYCNMF